MAISSQDARPLAITEQHIQDPVSGLTIEFEVLPDGTQMLKVFGDFPLGNREFIFSPDGLEAGATLTDHPPASAASTGSG